jgi:hypothetical protein
MAVEARTAGDVVLHLRTTDRLAPQDVLAVTVAPQHLLVYPS